MKIKELMPLIEAQNDAPGADLEREVLCGYTCDLLSWVMAHGAEGHGLGDGANAYERDCRGRAG